MIYFIKANDRVKIGYADDPKSRIQSIQTSSPYKLEVLLIIDGSYEVERDLHKSFQEFRITGEWFEFAEGLVSFIKENRNKDRKFEFGFSPSAYANNEQVLRLRTRHNLTLSAL